MTGGLRRAVWAIRPWQRDLALVLALTAVSQAELATADDTDAPLLAAAAALACTLALLGRRRWPFAVATGIGLVLAGASLLDAPPESVGVLLAVVVAIYTVASDETVRRALVAAAIVAIGLSVSIVFDTTDSADNIAPTLLLFVAVPFAASRVVRERARRTSQEALHAERARIARELHDVVAHGVSVIALQADAAAAALEHDPARAREPIQAIGATARDALAELRRLLEILREPGDDDPLAPPPGVARLPELVSRVRNAGLGVELRVEGSAGELAPGIDLALFRVTQEALTNALRHSGRADVCVTLRYRPADVEVEVVDDGRGASASGDGFGLVGMRERVALYGGRLVAGPRPGGGYGVLATLPR